jgi:hypothetical protein
VNRQQALVASLERDGRNTIQVVVLLDAHSKTLLVYENQREKILIKLHHSRL